MSQFEWLINSPSKAALDKISIFAIFINFNKNRTYSL